MRWPSDFPGNHPRQPDHSIMRWLMVLMDDIADHGFLATLRKRASWKR